MIKDIEIFNNVIGKVSNLVGYNETPEFLGKGINGIAYSVGDKVLKITSDDYEASIADKTRKQSPTNHFVNYYDVRPLKYKNYSNLYLLVMDKVKELPKEIQDMNFRTVKNDEVSFSRLLNSYLTPREFNFPLYREVMENPETKKVLESNPLLLKLIKQFPEIRKEFQKAPYSLDLHNKNLGINDNGNLQIFDQNSEQPINRKRLNKGIIV